MNREKKQLGIALVSVLSVATVCIILAMTFSFVITSERRNTTMASRMADSLQLADAATERARMLIVQNYKDSFLTSTNFLKKLHEGTLANLDKNQVMTIWVGDKAARWKIADYAQATDSFHWLEIAATAETVQGVQTVIRRINLGQSDVFTLAMLSEKTDCVYCHLRVNGDVGSLGFLRPGWGDEGVSGHGSGADLGGSRVNGDAYIAPSKTDPSVSNISGDNTDITGSPKTINGAEFTGDVVTMYTGSRLPTDKDGDGIPDFPAIDKTVAQNNANGAISGGELIYTVPAATSLATIPLSSNSAGINKTYNGNVILVGTQANPIVINEDVYISGDVIIKGYVTGKGAIYAGRNLYAAGNIRYLNPPSNCSKAANPDTCAQQSVVAADDELRFAARGNIILGDYTEKTAAGTEKSWQASQAVDYFRSQFGFWDGSKKSYDKSTGDELKCSASMVCKNADGKDIPPANIIEVNGNNAATADAYDYSMRPGSINPTTGAFQEWLSDGLYQQIVGTETRKNDAWRKDINRESLRPANPADPASVQTAMDYLRMQFGPAGALLSEQSVLDIMCLNSSLAAVSCTDPLNLTDTSGTLIGVLNQLGNPGRIIVDIYAAASYEKQVTHVDAYLYANQRIAGKTFKAPLVVNGGMVAREIGVLAPGIDPANEDDCSKQSFADQYRDVSLAATDPDFYNGVYNPDASDCALTINYDYRLRNGGFGYNLVAQDVGRTSSWRVADKRSERVAAQ